MSQSPVDALDALIADFAKNSGVLPQVNPPEAVKVLETQTKPEAKKTRGRKATEDLLADFCYNVFLTALVLGMCGAFGV